MPMPSSPDRSSPDRPRAISASAEAPSQPTSAWTQTLADYWELTKPEISFLVVISALAGYLLALTEGALLDGWTLLWTLIGVGLCAGGVGVLNHVLEHPYDAQMKRTAQRPIPAGRVAPKSARTVGVLMVCAGVGLLCPLVNPLTGVLAALTCALYLFVYTPLKRITTYNTLIGTIPGALPALGGYAAATGTLGWSGWVIFAILAAWQMPHFLALAWMYRKDYERGDYAMLPVVEPDGDSTARQMMGFTALLLIVSLAPVWTANLSWLYLAGAVPLGGWFLWTTIAFYGERTGLRARRVLKASIVYIPVLVGLIFADWML